MEKGKIIFLGGVSSSGKTTLAKVLQSKLTTPYYQMCCDDFFDMPPRQKMYDDFPSQLMLLHGLMLELIASFSDKGHNVIVADLVLNTPPPHTNDWLYKYITKFENYPILFVRVDCAIEELERREIKRGDRPVGTSRSQLPHIDYEVPYDLVVNTYENTTEECADRIISKLNNQNEWFGLKNIKGYIERKRCGNA